MGWRVGGGMCRVRVVVAALCVVSLLERRGCKRSGEGVSHLGCTNQTGLETGRHGFSHLGLWAPDGAGK